MFDFNDSLQIQFLLLFVANAEVSFAFHIPVI